MELGFTTRGRGRTAQLCAVPTRISVDRPVIDQLLNGGVGWIGAAVDDHANEHGRRAP